MALTAVSETVSMTIWARVTAEHGFSLVLRVVSSGQDKFDVIIINKGHESVVLVHGEDSLLYQVDEASLVSDVVNGSIDSDDNFAQLIARSVSLKIGVDASE